MRNYSLHVVGSSRSYRAVRSVPAAEVTTMPLGPKAHCDTESVSASCNNMSATSLPMLKMCTHAYTRLS